MSFLRIFLGYYYFDLWMRDWKQYISKSGFYSEIFVESLNRAHVPGWYRLLLAEYIIPNWQVFAFIILGLQLCVAISYFIGYVVRPVSIIAVLLCLNYIMLSPIQMEFFYKLLIASHFMLAWVGAGRCLGIDYYFYKRRRGMWW
jgi:thiosulfate dehydrogenase [quinone] large subunit